VKYEPGDPNHDRYVRKINLNPPFGEPSEPHYVRFDMDFGSHQHYVLGLRDDSNPPLEPYGWPLEAASFIGPRLPPTRSDNEALGIFDAGYPGAVEVDIALYELKDYGVTADVDRYRGHMLEYEALLEEKKALDKKLSSWRSKALGPRCRLIQAHARNRLHPYLHQYEPITRPSGYRTQEPFVYPPQTFSMSSCLLADANAGELESQRPWFEERLGVRYVFPDTEFRRRCTYCHGRGHIPLDCDRPHAKCHTLPRCLISRRHPHHGGICPHYYDDPVAFHPGLEDEGYVGHEDEEGDGES
jgi:hypothetical protein